MMEEDDLSIRLAHFLRLQKPLLASQSSPQAALGHEKLGNLIAELSPHLAQRAAAGDATDIWSVIGLRRNEVNTARILRKANKVCSYIPKPNPSPFLSFLTSSSCLNISAVLAR